MLRCCPYALLTAHRHRVTVSGISCNPLGSENAANLQFLGVDPESPVDESPTIWVEEGTGDLIIQSYRADGATIDEAKRVGSIPGHSTDIPAGETMIRLPARMLQFIPRPDGDPSATTST